MTMNQMLPESDDPFRMGDFQIQIPEFDEDQITFEDENGTVFILSGGSIYTEIMAGGVVDDGTTKFFLIENPANGGGVVCGSSARVSCIENPTPSGGVVCGGSASSPPLKTSYLAFKGGVKVSGTATVNVLRSIDVGGGVIVAGTSTNYKRSREVASGGVLVAGHFIDRYVCNVRGRGGVKIRGTGRVIFFDWVDGTGGVKIKGKGTIERIKFRLPRIQTGIRRAIIHGPYYEEEKTTEELIRPTNEIAPELEEDPVREELIGIWCDVEEACEEGVLPEVIQVRNKGFLPPKKGAIVPRDRSFATTS